MTISMHLYRTTPMLSATLAKRHSLHDNTFPGLYTRRKLYNTSTNTVSDAKRQTTNTIARSATPNTAVAQPPTFPERKSPRIVVSNAFSLAKKVWSIFLWHCVICVWLVHVTRLFQRFWPSTIPLAKATQHPTRTTTSICIKTRPDAPKHISSKRMGTESLRAGPLTTPYISTTIITTSSTSAPLANSRDLTFPVNKRSTSSPFMGQSLAKYLTDPHLIALVKTHEKKMADHYKDYIPPTSRRRASLRFNVDAHAEEKSPALVQLVKDIQDYVGESNVLHTNALVALKPDMREYLTC